MNRETVLYSIAGAVGVSAAVAGICLVSRKLGKKSEVSCTIVWHRYIEVATTCTYFYSEWGSKGVRDAETGE